MGRRDDGEGRDSHPPDVNHPPLLSAGGRAKWMGKPRTSLFPKNNSDEPAFPLKSLIRGFVVGISNPTSLGKGSLSFILEVQGREGGRGAGMTGTLWPFF